MERPGASRKAPRVVRSADLLDPGRTSGVVRLQAFDHEKVWAGMTINAPNEMSKWHLHGRETYGYVVEGKFRVEYGPGGKDFVEIPAGSFVHVPAGIVHREGCPVDGPNRGIAFRIGDGPLVIDVDGPEPEE